MNNHWLNIEKKKDPFYAQSLEEYQRLIDAGWIPSNRRTPILTRYGKKAWKAWKKSK